MTNINTFQGDVFIHEYIKHTGDDNTYFGFSGDDTIVLRTDGTDRLVVGGDGNVTITNAIIIPDYIYHNGDTNTYFGFDGADSYVIFTNGTQAFEIDSSQLLYMPSFMRHLGDNNTYFGFSGEDSIAFYTGGNHAIDIASNGTTRFYDTMYIVDYIAHYSDNDTFFGFPSNDTFKIRTAGTDRLTIDSSGFSTFANTLRASAMGVGVSPSGVALQVSGYTKSDYLVSDYGALYASRLVGHAVYYLVNKTLMFLWESQNGSYPAYGMQFLWYRSGVGIGSQSIIPPSGPAAYQESGYIKYYHPGPSFSMTWRTIRWN